MIAYRLKGDEFIIEDYMQARAFASFLPGIAGLWGIPLWAFYVNRGQAMAGFGVQDKDHPIMEFQAANRAFRVTPSQGFRTFLKFHSRQSSSYYEPFQPLADGLRKTATQRMRIRMHDLLLEETNRTLGLEIQVHYFTIPNEPYAGLARSLSIVNRSRKPVAYELLDGLPIIVPHGMRDYFLKNMNRTIEAWVAVDNLQAGAPFYRLKVEPHDKPEVVSIRAGNFYVGCSTLGERKTGLHPIIDPALVFGPREDLGFPQSFLSREFILPKKQHVQDKTPCAFSYTQVRLLPGQTHTVHAVFGHAETVEHLNNHLENLQTPAFFSRKAAEGRTLIEQLTQRVATQSRYPQFDAYCRQTFLDNMLRGGSPVFLGGPHGRKAVYVYSRKHGDLERDYNYFILTPTYFSQGNANYRDVNQNRRNDVWFNPEVGEHNIITFFNLIQADGFNPLIYKGTRYVPSASAQYPAALREALGKSFTPGEFLRRVERRHLDTGESMEALLNRVMSEAREVEDAEHGEGFWTDHWTYNLDLLESYLALYPERLKALLCEERVFSFYDNPHGVAPRVQKYRLVHGMVRQFHAVVKDVEKESLIRLRTEDAHRMRTQNGQGPVYTTTLLVKMLCIILNKAASLDPDGIGVEMEADRPNWADSLNGLPGILGSSLCETFELKRWIVFLLKTLENLGDSAPEPFVLPEEMDDFLHALDGLWQEKASAYWAKSADARENYRERIRFGFSGVEKALDRQRLSGFLNKALRKTEAAISLGFDSASGLYNSYFYYEVTAHTTASFGEHAGILPTAWKRHTLPLFLEANVHALRTESSPAQAEKLHRAVRKSALYDRGLSMYRVCASLESATEEIGRCRIFNPGWLENQSVWLHMEYKYLLELLRSGLYEAYYAELLKQLIAFQPPRRYGRSVLENSSFLVSSIYADKSLHGAGFVARLSGATAEFLHLWLWMAAGRKPFLLNAQGQLMLCFEPILSGDFFTSAGKFIFVFLGHTEVVYLNPSRRPTFGSHGVRPQSIRLQPRSGSLISFKDGTIPSPYAAMVRAGAIARIEIELAA